MKLCPVCSASNGDGVKFCVKCGAEMPISNAMPSAGVAPKPMAPPPFSPKTPPPPPIAPAGKLASSSASSIEAKNSAKSKNNVVIVGVAVVAVAVVIAAFFMMSGGSKVSGPAVSINATENSIQVKTLLNNLLTFANDNDWAKIEQLAKELNSQAAFKKGDRSASKALSEQGLKELSIGMESSIKKSIDNFAKAVAIDESNTEARANLGYAEYLLGNHDKAITILGQSLVADPERARAWLYVAEVFAEKGKDEASLNSLKLAVYFSKNHAKALSILNTEAGTINSRKFEELIKRNMTVLTAIPDRK